MLTRLHKRFATTRRDGTIAPMSPASPPDSGDDVEMQTLTSTRDGSDMDLLYMKAQTFSSVLSTPPLTPPSPNEESQGSDKRAVLRKSVSLSSSDSSSRRRSSSEIDDACDEHFEDHHCDDHEHDGKYHNKDIRKKRFRDATRDASRKNQRRAKERGHCPKGNKRASSCRRLTAVRLVRYTATGWIALRLGWWVYWTSGCREGGYTRATMATGGEGPEQVHLAYSGSDDAANPSAMTVIWTTAAGETPPRVQYGFSPDKLNITVEGTSVRYLETVHHRATLKDLTPGTRVYYRCGHEDDAQQQQQQQQQHRDGVATAGTDATTTDHGGAIAPPPVAGRDDGSGTWSDISSFMSAPDPQRWAGTGPWEQPVSVAVVGDLGLVNADVTFQRLHQLVEDEEVDFVLHLGDIAYADDSFLERPLAFGYEDKWDAYMRRVSHSFGTRTPYMVVPGNHEAECHSPACLLSRHKSEALGRFSAYNARFRMPSLESGAEHGTAMWFSFNIGPVHWVVIDTETDFPEAPGDKFTWWGDDDVGNGGFGDQLAWLEEDLAQADQDRNVRPWIIVSGHRPMYSKDALSSTGRPEGTTERVRNAFEPLLMRYKVDVYLSGHDHTYERSYPVYDWEVHLDSENAPIPTFVYDDPTAPVHIVNGAGGNIEGMTIPQPILEKDFPKWHARSLDFEKGVGILTFNSINEMRASFVTSAGPAKIEDELILRHHRPSP